MSKKLSFLGGLTAEQFLAEYWQKKPLLVRNAIPEIVGMFEPSDIQELALDQDITARLIRQTGKNHDQWQVKNSPLQAKDFNNLPQFWTLLVQAVDHYSVELADLWQKFAFIPQWRRDDVMVSYAPKGGSVGKHFDYYDVFLVQGYGHRRWQLGQWCDENTPFIPNQPLKLLHDMDVDFDEVLAPGDLLYVPPRLSHYGVAQDDCLTFSFGFRMPNMAQLMDRVSDAFADQNRLKAPLQDILRQKPQAVGEITAAEFDDLKQKLLNEIRQNPAFEQSIMALMSEPKYPDNLPDEENYSLDDFTDLYQHHYYLRVEPASRLLYREVNGELDFWANGEPLCVDSHQQMIFKRLADGEKLALDDLIENHQLDENLVNAVNQAILFLEGLDEDDE